MPFRESGLTRSDEGGLDGGTKWPGGVQLLRVGNCVVGSLRGTVGVSTLDVSEECGPLWPLLQATFLAEV